MSFGAYLHVDFNTVFKAKFKNGFSLLQNLFHLSLSLSLSLILRMLNFFLSISLSLIFFFFYITFLDFYFFLSVSFLSNSILSLLLILFNSLFSLYFLFSSFYKNLDTEAYQSLRRSYAWYIAVVKCWLRHKKAVLTFVLDSLRLQSMLKLTLGRQWRPGIEPGPLELLQICRSHL